MPEDEEDIEDEEEDKDDKMVEAKKLVIGPLIIWIGIFLKSTYIMAAHNVVQNILALFKDYQITNINIKYCKFFYILISIINTYIQIDKIIITDQQK